MTEPNPAPRVALVHDWLTGMRGGERVLEAVAALFPGAPIHTLFHFPGSVSPALEAHPVRTSFLQRAPGVRRHYRRYLPLFPVAVEEFDLNGFDLVLSTSHCVAKGAIPPPGARHLCYVHTPMRYAWDQEHAYFPGRRGLAARVRGLVLSRLRTWDTATVARVDRFVANSRFVAERIRRYYGREAVVLAPPVDTEFFTPARWTEEGPGSLPSGRLGQQFRVGEAPRATTDEVQQELRAAASPSPREGGKGIEGMGGVRAQPGREGEEKPGPRGEGAGSPGSGPSYALVVSAPAPYKRVDLGVRACREAGIDVVVVGPGAERLRRLRGAGVELRGRVDGPELRELYRHAVCLVQPGVEDFGIAPVEALACGTPVVALGRGGVLDIVDDGVHGVLTEPVGDDAARVRSLAAAIDKARGLRFNTLDLRRRAEGFSVDRFQRGFRALVDDLLTGGPGGQVGEATP